jgi:hypothetical protein
VAEIADVGGVAVEDLIQRLAGGRIFLVAQMTGIPF